MQNDGELRRICLFQLITFIYRNVKCFNVKSQNWSFVLIFDLNSLFSCILFKSMISKPLKFQILLKLCSQIAKFLIFISCKEIFSSRKLLMSILENFRLKIWRKRKSGIAHELKLDFYHTFKVFLHIFTTIVISSNFVQFHKKMWLLN